jgi:tRNA pseudouridine synthase 10
MRSAGHEIATFALEVTLPPSIPMRQAATRALLVEALRGVSAENAFSSPPATTELRDAFRATLVPALEATAIDRVTNRVRHDPNAPFKFALLFEHERCRSEAGFATRKAEEHGNRDGRNRKRRAPPPQLQLATLPDSPAATWQRVGAAYNISEKRAAEAFTTVASFEADEYASRAMAAVRGEESRDESRESRKTNGRATCRLFPWHAPCYLGGRYLKWKRGVPQSPWFADGGVVGEGSVQTSLETFVVKAFKSRGCRLNSAGREDMDVRMLGGGRPFILEVHDPKRPGAFAEESERQEMESFLADDNDGAVTATNIHVVPREAYITMHEGSAEKRKTYTAVCWASRALSETDLSTLTTRCSGLTVHQKTPTRVLHRRTSATRPRVIHDAKAFAVKGSPKFFLLELTTQAGTYIKEFVHGDFGRTSPSVGSILGCEADILQLDVTDIEMAFGGPGGEEPGEEE